MRGEGCEVVRTFIRDDEQRQRGKAVYAVLTKLAAQIPASQKGEEADVA